MKRTLAQRFKAKAAELMPNQDALQELDDAINDDSHIDEIMFHKGEYTGGMAVVILKLIE